MHKFALTIPRFLTRSSFALLHSSAVIPTPPPPLCRGEIPNRLVSGDTGGIRRQYSALSVCGRLAGAARPELISGTVEKGERETVPTPIREPGSRRLRRNIPQLRYRCVPGARAVRRVGTYFAAVTMTAFKKDEWCFCFPPSHVPF